MIYSCFGASRCFYNRRLDLLSRLPRISQIQQTRIYFQAIHSEGRRYNSSRRVEKSTWIDKFEELRTILGQPPEAVRALLNRGRCLLMGDKESMSKTWEVLKKFGYGIESLNEYPRLLLETPASAENYILIMQESGFVSIRPYTITKYRDLSLRTIKSLKLNEYIPPKLDVLQNYCKILNLPWRLELEIRNNFELYEGNIPLVDIRMYVLSHFLAHRLDSSLPEVNALIIKNRRNRHRSYKWISQTIDVLINDMQFTKEKIIKHGYLLQCDPNRLKEIVTTLPTLGGKSVVEVVNARPKILASSAKTLCEIEVLFNKHGINSTAISKYPELYTLSSKTVQQRLEELDKIPQFTTFKSHPRIARVIYYQNKVKKRLFELEAMDVHGVSLHILSTDTQRYDRFLQLGEMINKGADITHFISSYLGEGVSRVQVRQYLAVHPHWLHVPVVKVKDTLDFLRVEKGLEVSKILKVLPLVLYSAEQIKEAMIKVIQSGEAKEEDEFYLQMVLYFLERPGHFTGDGVWPNKNSMRDEILERNNKLNDSRNALRLSIDAFRSSSGDLEDSQTGLEEVEVVEDDEEVDVGLARNLPLGRLL